MNALDYLALFFNNSLVLLFLTILLTGVLAAEARVALEVLHVHQKFNLNILDDESKKWVLGNNLRFKRYIIGITTAFIAIITLAREMDPLNQAVIGLIAALSGNTFILKQIDGNLESALDSHLKDKASSALFELEKVLDELANLPPEDEIPETEEVHEEPKPKTG
ncbi:hypothetical protein [Halalkalibacter nanhaiisediminis]|uniref:Uncharacterized protein n=1 Tax=Halalkalibacter nanhaiisediminis TaxID=688079 RepID=A0A562QHU0_9BACI|nr:hypothetical protein [Halalkalibacter nanhaiisediminis]TWI56328.1 hypothetical protein IQ10_02222 [Halalkalibacter nanhaiisediminis]